MPVSAMAVMKEHGAKIPGQRVLYERFMSHLGEADRLLERVQSEAMNNGGFSAIRDPANPIHHLDEVLLAISDVRASMIAYIDRHSVR